MKRLLLVGSGGDIGAAIFSCLQPNFDIIKFDREHADLASHSEIERGLLQVTGSIDGLVFCPAVNVPKPFYKYTTEELIEYSSINYLSFVQIISHFFSNNLLSNGASVVAISSLYGKIGRDKRLPYSFTKHALESCIKTLCIECSEAKIRFNTVSPGFIDTKLTRKNLNEDFLRELCKKIPASRLGLPKEIASVVKFLISEDSSYVNGTNIIVDGGFSSGAILN